MRTVNVTVINEVGLHARPAAIFVQAANRYTSQIKVRNLTKNGNVSDAKSILGVLVLGIEKNHMIELKIEGEDEEAAAVYLTKLVENDFQTTEENPVSDGTNRV